MNKAGNPHTIRAVTLNLNHRTRPKLLPRELIDALGALAPDVLVLTEYVAGKGDEQLLQDLACHGLAHVAVSESTEYAKGRWSNQVLAASRDQIAVRPLPHRSHSGSANSNTLLFSTLGLRFCGLRVPAYVPAPDWYGYWEWLPRNVPVDVVIGDLNADPNRADKRHRVIHHFREAGGWTLAPVEGESSYFGTNGSRSCIDHVLVSNGVSVERARYQVEPFVPDISDHAALVADLARPMVD